jgi:hypothetical protein
MSPADTVFVIEMTAGDAIEIVQVPATVPVFDPEATCVGMI